MDNNLDTWKTIVYKRVTNIYNSITNPPFLEEEKNRIAFTSEIENYIIQEIKTNKLTFDQRRIFIYNILLPLQSHFDGKEEQTFITEIKDNVTMKEAIKRILRADYQWYSEKIIKTTQCIPTSAMHNYSGNSVGRGLRMPGTIQYWCLTCKKYVGFSPDAYWSHQENIHNNPRIRVTKIVKRMNKFKF